MKNRFLIAAVFGLILLAKASPALSVTDTTYSGNFIVIENQSGFQSEEYELRAAKKFERGIKNFFFGWLEVPQGVKSHIAYREDNYLPVGVETYILGFFHGGLYAVGRTLVGAYEMFTPFFVQDPILVEMEEWLY